MFGFFPDGPDESKGNRGKAVAHSPLALLGSAMLSSSQP